MFSKTTNRKFVFDSSFCKFWIYKWHSTYLCISLFFQQVADWALGTLSMKFTNSSISSLNAEKQEAAAFLKYPKPQPLSFGSRATKFLELTYIIFQSQNQTKPKHSGLDPWITILTCQSAVWVPWHTRSLWSRCVRWCRAGPSYSGSWRSGWHQW